jgi:hypothetical protein
MQEKVKKVGERFGGTEKLPYLCTRKQEGHRLLGDAQQVCRPCGSESRLRREIFDMIP